MAEIKQQYGEDFVPPDFIKRKFSTKYSTSEELKFKVKKNALPARPKREEPVLKI